jgi:hypothetical protein
MPMSARLLRPRQTGKYAALRTGLVAYWPLNETATSGDVTAEDWTKRGNNLTSNNSVLSLAGKINNARGFVAANTEYLSIASNSDVQFGNGDWSLSLWVQPRETTTISERMVVAKDASGARELTLSVTTNANAGNQGNRFELIVFNTSNSPSISLNEPSDTLNAAFVNIWFHLAVVNSGGVVTLYRNGASRATATRPGGQTFNASSAQLNIGRRQFVTAENYASAYVDEIAKWTRALSASEISDLYNSGNGIDLRQ